jgi:ribonuclease D
MTNDLRPVRLLTEISHIEWLAERLQGEPRIAVDLESDGFYVYHEKVCLLQISSEKEDFIVDPLLAKDISPLGGIFRDPSVETVFHAAEYDISSLKRDFGFETRGVFDTMAAARTLGKPKLGLAGLIEEYFGITLSKKLQRANWGKRPLTEEQLQYARLDTHFLLRLRDKIEKELIEHGRLKDAQDAFRRVERTQPSCKSFDPEGFWRLKGSRELSPQGLAVLRELYLYREKTAEELDRAPFRVLPEHILVLLAARRPDTLEAFSDVGGMTPYLLHHFGQGLADAVARGLKAPAEGAPPETPRGDWNGPTARRYEALRAWRKALALERGVEPVVILETTEAKALADAASKSEDTQTWLAALSDFKRETYGADILRILQSVPGAGAAGEGPHRPRRRRRRKPSVGG